MSRRSVLAVIGAVVLGTALIVGGFAAGAALIDDTVTSAAAQQTDERDARTITVSATGEAETQPDKTLVRLTVQASADDPTVARERVATNVSAVRAALTDLGLGSEQVRTVDFAIYSDEERHETGKAGSVTYRARHTLLVEVNEINRTGAVIDGAVDAGATDIHDVRYTLSEDTREQLRQQALRNAMGSASRQATTLAEEASLEITGVHAVSTVDVGYEPRRLRVAMAADSGGTELASGPVSVSVSVSVQFNATDA